MSDRRVYVYRDEAGEYRWQLLHENGHVLGDSGEGYKNKADAVEQAKKNFPEFDVEESE